MTTKWVKFRSQPAGDEGADGVAARRARVALDGMRGADEQVDEAGDEQQTHVVRG